MSEKSIVLNALLRQDLSPGNQSFQNILTRIAISHLKKNSIEAEKFAERNLKKYWNWMLALTDEHKARGLMPYFLVPSSSSYSIACAGHELITAHEDKSQLFGRNLKNRAILLGQLDKLNDREYEALAGVVCKAIGVREFVLTPPGNEGGIDFLAHIVTQSSTPIFPSPGTSLRVVGQCKKYATALAVDTFENFIQTLHNVRYRSNRVRRHIPSWFSESNSPIIGWMIGHSGFQTGSADEGKQHGIYMSDAVDLVEILCHGIDGINQLHPNLIHSKCQDFL